MPECINISGNESTWLPGQIQDKLKSNLQGYLGMKIVVDSKSEVIIKQLQRESEDSGRDENTSIELGKISTASFAVLTKIRKTGKGYSVSLDYTDVTTGIQNASVSSKEYTTYGELYNETGAIDELTLLLAEKLNIAINPIQKQALRFGTADFTLEDQLKLARENEEHFKKLIEQFDDQILALSVSNDLNANENTKKIEAEKALLKEKQESEKKRLLELEEQKKKADEDARLEAERSAEQKKQRNLIAEQAAKKANEVRKLKLEKQGVFGQISVIESQKKALIEIRENTENRIKELYEQIENEKQQDAETIRNKTWSSVELEDGIPTKTAKQRRENLVLENNEKLTIKFIDDAKKIKNSVSKTDAELLEEIRSNQKEIIKIRTVNSLGSELKVSYGTYSSKRKGWNAYISIYSDGILLYNDTFLISYKSLIGKDAPDIDNLSDSEMQKYIDTVDMYNSLLTRGDPILYFELDYIASARSDDFPSEYDFDFKALRIINTISGKIIQKISNIKIITHSMNPAWNLCPLKGLLEEVEEPRIATVKARADGIPEEYLDLYVKKIKPWLDSNPAGSYMTMDHELVKEILGYNETITERLLVSLCNRLSIICGFKEPYYWDKNGLLKEKKVKGFRYDAATYYLYLKRTDPFRFKMLKDFPYDFDEPLNSFSVYIK